MSFLVSPGVHVREIDLTNVVPSVQTTIGAIAAPFEKGPVSRSLLVHHSYTVLPDLDTLFHQT